MSMNKKWIGLAEKWGSRLGSLFFLSLNFSLSKRKPSNKILFIKYCCFGDAVLSLYAIRKYKELNPNKKVYILCSIRIKEIYQHSSLFEEVHSLPMTGTNGFRELLKIKFLNKVLNLIGGLRSYQFDELIDLELYRYSPLFFKSALNIPKSRGFWVSGAAIKKHDNQVVREINSPEWKTFYDLLEIPLGKNEFPPPLFEAANLPEKKEVGIVFGSSPNWPQKKWPLNYFIQLIQGLIEEGYSVSIFGSKHECEEAEIISNSFPDKIENFTGRLNYKNLLEKVSQCQLMVGNDTGPMHLAAAANVDTLTLFGPTNPQKWNPLMGTPIFKSNLECRPCYYLSKMPFCSHQSCLKKLRPELVTQQVLDKLKN